MTELRVVIVTSGRPQRLEDTLESIKQCHGANLIQELVVAENGHQQHAKALVESYSCDLPMRYLYTSVPGKCRALNLALEVMPNDCLILFADDDVKCSKNWIQQYADASQKHPECCFFGGPTTAKYECPPSEWLERHLPLSTTGMELEDFSDGPNATTSWASIGRPIAATYERLVCSMR